MKKVIELKYKYNKLNLEHESSIRIEALAKNIGAIIKQLCPSARKGLDIGCQRGQITDIISRNTNIAFYGIEPDPNEVLHCLKSVTVIRGHAEDIPFPDSTFDVITVISVIEHISPINLKASFYEIFRVLKPVGYCIGQIPNMNFPIEVHSRLPFQQFLPRKIKDKYLDIFKGKDLKTEWYRTSLKKVSRLASEVGFDGIFTVPFLYPRELFPKRLLPLCPVLKILPLDYVFWFRKGQ